MIPHKLKLHNFMCYREEQSLDFSGIHLACLTGDNGHGKSALLDAMTWALWGRARARRDDELIALGESEMWVDLEFGLGPQRYRVWRQRSKRGRGQTDLHLYIWNEGSEDWQLLDEGGINERQALIIRTLRMEYDTFANSAFLLQGRADSFTVKTASERKQILADILGLNRYDLYEEQAKEEIRARKERAIRVQGEIGGIDHALARRGEFEAQLAGARHAVTQAVEALRAAEAEQATLRLEVQGLRGQAHQLADLRNRMARAERDLAEMRDQYNAAQRRLTAYEQVLAEQEAIETGWRALQDAREQEAAYNTKLRRDVELQAQLLKLDQAIQRARDGLQMEQAALCVPLTGTLAGELNHDDVTVALLRFRVTNSGAWPSAAASGSKRPPSASSRRRSWPRHRPSWHRWRNSRRAAMPSPQTSARSASVWQRSNPTQKGCATRDRPSKRKVN